MTKIHELFNADGNDDILSDIGGGVDIRNGMTAITPNTVDEDGSSKFSTDSAIGQDEFPPQENLVEDLEYNHVGDATKDRFIMTEAEGINYYLTRIIRHVNPEEGNVEEQIDLTKRIAGEVLNDYFPIMESVFNKGDKPGFIKALKNIINYIRKEGFKYKEFVLINPVDALQQMFTVIGFLKEEDRDFHIKTIRQVLEELTRENLNENNEISDNERKENFKIWFGDSKVVDDHGNPLVVYHGTGANFDTFEKSNFGGFYFAKNVATAQEFLDLFNRGLPQSIMPAYLSIQNPYIKDFGGEYITKPLEEIQPAKEGGYDGAIYKNVRDGVNAKTPATDIYVAFSSNQIKSAIGNKGTFNPTSNSVIDERIVSSMPGSSTVSVKKKCKLGGLGGTSAACNQGDISNLDIKPLKEGYLPNNTFWAWVSPDDQFYQVPVLNHKDFIMRRYKDRDFSWDYDRIFDIALEEGWIRVIYEKFPNDFRAELNLNGYTKDRVFSVFKTMFYDLVKYGNNSIYLEWENPKDHITFSTRTGEGKTELFNAINEEVDVSNLNIKPLNEYEEFGDVIETSVKQGEKEEIYRDNNYIVVKPLTHYAARKYGCDTNWCTSVSDPIYFDSHTKDNNFLLYIINRNATPSPLHARNEKINQFTSMYNSGDWDNMDDEEKEKLLDYSRIAISVDYEDEGGGQLYPELRIWDANDFELSEFTGNYGNIDELPIPQNVKTSINNYLNKNLKYPQNEDLTVNLPASSTGGGWNSHNIINDGEIVGEMELTDRKNQYLTLNKIIIHREFRGRGYADKAMRLLIDFADKNNKILTLTPDNTWGASKERLKKWYMSYGFVPNKGRHADYQTSESMYRLPKSLNEAVSIFNNINEAKLMIFYMGKINDFVNGMKQKSFIISLINDLRADIYIVGGVVRDLILNKPNKDIDLIVRNVTIDALINNLQKFGKVNIVGKSFGVLKFIDGDGTDYDIALPRKEQPTGEGGYRGFDVQSDPNMSIEDDLSRRDVKMNAMAININTGKFIDPLGGLNDIENKQISAANSKAFSDDPLRMLRIVGFASRFGFTIEPETMKMIQTNAGRIKEIPAERVLIEFDKIVKKGNKRMGAQLLKNTGLFQNIFGFDIKQSTIDRSPFEDVKTMGEFIFLLIYLNPNPAEYYKNNLRGDINTYKEIKALDAAYNGSQETNPVKARAIAHNVYVLSPQTFQSTILPENIENAARELVQGKYPKTLGELMVNGNDLMTLGFKGSEIGDMLKNILLKIYADKLRNDKQELIKFAQENKGVDVKRDIADIQEGLKSLNLDHFVDKYDQWNSGNRFHNPSKESVLRFLEDEFPDLVDDERLKNELRWKLTDREVLNEGVEEKPPMNRVSYTGVMLDKESRKQLLKVFNAMIPEEWEVIAHHMTIRLNELDPGTKEYQDMKGSKTITLNVVDYAINDLVMAVGVTGYPSESVKPHITLAINKEEGGKPAMSKELTDWKPLGFRFKVSGKIEEVENQLVETPQNTSGVVKRLAIFDFDGTLMNSPHPEVGKQEWSEKTGEKFPHIGWWSKPESLDLDVFDIKPFPGIYNQYQKEKSTPDTYVIILTSRIEKLRSQVEEILKRGGVHVDRLDMKNGDDDLDKGQKALNYLKEFPNVQEINVYEDRDVELEAYNAIKNQIPENVRFNIYFADRGNLALTESKLLNTIKEEIQKLI